MNKLKFRKHRQRLMYALASVLTAVCILATSVQTYARTPDAAFVAQVHGSGISLGAGKPRPPAQVNDQLRMGNILYVPGNNSPWAKLGFVVDSVNDYDGLMVQAGPHSTQSEWSFPCTGRAGSFAIAWKRGNNRGCEAGGITLSFGSNQIGTLPKPIDSLQAAKNTLKAQTSSDQVIIVPPNSEAKLLQTRNSGTNIEIETIQGDILVKSDQYPQGRLIPEGKRYRYPLDTIEDLNRDEIAKSPEMQDFLNPDNWLSPDIPQRVADGIADQLGQHRVALGLPTNNAGQIAARPESGQSAPRTATNGDLAKGTSYGDPHIITFDGFRYSFQTVGEFVLAESTSGNFEVQARQSQIPNRDFSLNTAAAMKVGNNRVAFYAKSFPDSDTSTPLRVNGKPTVVEGGSLALPGGGTISQQGDSYYLVEWPTGEQVGIQMLGDGFMNISPAVPSSSRGQYTGLLGNLDGNPSNDLRTRSGNVLPSKSTYGQIRDAVSSIVPIPGISAINRVETAVFDQLYKDFGDSWRISQNESLFDYASGQTTATFTNRNFPTVYKTLEMLSSDQIEAAEATCLEAGVEPKLLEGCIFDVGFTGDESFAQSAASALKLIDGFIPGGIPRPPVSIPGLPF